MQHYMRYADNGQMRFEVRCLDASGIEQVVGWTNDASGADLLSLLAAQHMDIDDVRMITLAHVH